MASYQPILTIKNYTSKSVRLNMIFAQNANTNNPDIRMYSKGAFGTIPPGSPTSPEVVTYGNFESANPASFAPSLWYVTKYPISGIPMYKLPILSKTMVTEMLIGRV